MNSNIPVMASLAGLAVSACGSGKSSGGNSTDTLNSKAVPSETQAARFLMQASFGGTYDQVKDVQTKGFEAWLDAEMAKPWNASNSHYN